MSILEFVKFVVQVNLTLMVQVIVLILGVVACGVIYAPAIFCIFKGFNLVGDLLVKIIIKVREKIREINEGVVNE